MTAEAIQDAISTLDDVQNVLRFMQNAGRIAYDNPSPFIDAVISLSAIYINAIEQVKDDIPNDIRPSPQ